MLCGEPQLVWTSRLPEDERLVFELLEKQKPSVEESEEEMECTNKYCVYNHFGLCRYSRVHERKPEMTERDGCLSGVLDNTNPDLD